MYSASDAVRRGLSEARTSPALASAKSVSTQRIELPSQVATRSPELQTARDQRIRKSARALVDLAKAALLVAADDGDAGPRKASRRDGSGQARSWRDLRIDTQIRRGRLATRVDRSAGDCLCAGLRHRFRRSARTRSALPPFERNQRCTERRTHRRRGEQRCDRRSVALRTDADGGQPAARAFGTDQRRRHRNRAAIVAACCPQPRRARRLTRSVEQERIGLFHFTRQPAGCARCKPRDPRTIQPPALWTSPVRAPCDLHLSRAVRSCNGRLGKLRHAGRADRMAARVDAAARVHRQPPADRRGLVAHEFPAHRPADRSRVRDNRSARRARPRRAPRRNRRPAARAPLARTPAARRARPPNVSPSRSRMRRTDERGGEHAHRARRLARSSARARPRRPKSRCT